jgi:hypothetical protein
MLVKKDACRLMFAASPSWMRRAMKSAQAGLLVLALDDAGGVLGAEFVLLGHELVDAVEDTESQHIGCSSWYTTGYLASRLQASFFTSMQM